MRIFILCTGRNGSVSFAKACQHCTNFSAGHETLSNRLGAERFAYPDQHIEADNRLGWFLGELNSTFGDEPYYVHLKRNTEKTVQSFMKRWGGRESIIEAYCEGMKMIPPETLSPDQRLQICRDYVHTVTTNIEDFLADKSKVMNIQIENVKTEFVAFWEAIGAEGDLEAALQTFDKAHNASANTWWEEWRKSGPYRLKLFLLRIWRRISS